MDVVRVKWIQLKEDKDMSMGITGNYSNYGASYTAAANRKQDAAGKRTDAAKEKTDTAGKKTDETGRKASEKALAKDKVAEYYGNLQKKYECVRNGKISISGSFLKECANDSEKAKQLEADLAFYKESCESGRKNAEAYLNSLGDRLVSYEETWSYDSKGNLTMIVQTQGTTGTGTKDWKELKEEQEKRLKERREKERIEEKRKLKKEQEKKIREKLQGDGNKVKKASEQSKTIGIKDMKAKIEEIKSNPKPQTPYSGEADVVISNEGLKRYHDNILNQHKLRSSGSSQAGNDNGLQGSSFTAGQDTLHHAGIMLTDYNTELGSRLLSSYGGKQSNGEYERVFPSVTEQGNSLLSAYAEMYDEIQRGYEAGTRETYVEDKASDTGYRKLTKEEELAELDKAFQNQADKFERRNNKDVVVALEAHAKKIAQIKSSGSRGVISGSLKELEARKAELEKLPNHMGKNLLDAAKVFAGQYDAQKTGIVDTASLLKAIQIF